ncbi:hypothetical protein QFC19_002278 [Naganishia cerealis]|uniref:Uncharacterized protein n=1 Tax=Naganishia cerealis TaxID=610337 RepID=A0ACC2WA99_9TREE|nr:hypothetical protein QFC19_002278 [Naganishia cerealis]
MKFFDITALVSALAVVLSPVTYAISGGYWPVSTPSSAEPWVIGAANSVVWGMGGELGIAEFDIQLHNFNKSIMTGFLLIAQNVPVKKWASGSKKVSFDLCLDTSIEYMDVWGLWQASGHAKPMK